MYELRSDSKYTYSDAELAAIRDYYVNLHWLGNRDIPGPYK